MAKLRAIRVESGSKEGVVLTREPSKALWSLFGRAKGTPIELVSPQFCTANCQSKRGQCVKPRDCIDAKACVHADE